MTTIETSTKMVCFYSFTKITAHGRPSVREFFHTSTKIKRRCPAHWASGEFARRKRHSESPCFRFQSWTNKSHRKFVSQAQGQSGGGMSSFVAQISKQNWKSYVKLSEGNRFLPYRLQPMVNRSLAPSPLTCGNLSPYIHVPME